jgi:hypothetical protein
MGASAPDLCAIGERFAIPGTFVHGAPLGSGHIHDTWAVTWREHGRDRRYVHQRLNERVFPDVPGLMENIGRITRHLQRRAEADADAAGGDARSGLTLVPARDGADWTRDDTGRAWRTCLLIEGAVSRDCATGPAQARAAAHAFGLFQRQVADLGGPPLRETIPRFHDTPARYAAFEAAVGADSAARAAAARAEIVFARGQAPLARGLADPAARGSLPLRVAHNDTKLNNVLFDAVTGEGLCVIDLDTVMRGVGLCDFGDLARTASCRVAEDERDLARVVVDAELFAALAAGWLAGAGDLITLTEREHLVTAARVMTFESGLRFLTDHLAGDPYFRVRRAGQNLDRCRAQFALLRSFTACEGELREAAARVGVGGGEDA